MNSESKHYFTHANDTQNYCDVISRNNARHLSCQRYKDTHFAKEDSHSDEKNLD